MSSGDLDAMRVSIELARGCDPARVLGALGASIKHSFEISAELVLLEPGTLAHEFESSVKAPRFAADAGVE